MPLNESAEARFEVEIEMKHLEARALVQMLHTLFMLKPVTKEEAMASLHDYEFLPDDGEIREDACALYIAAVRDGVNTGHALLSLVQEIMRPHDF